MDRGKMKPRNIRKYIDDLLLAIDAFVKILKSHKII
jgi:hypothetical protein